MLNKWNLGFHIRAILLGCFILLVAGPIVGAIAFAQTTTAKIPEFVDAKTCLGCHQKAYEAWSNSHHSWSMRLPDSKNVLGDFNDTRFSHKGVNSRFFKRAGRYFIETTGADGNSGEFEVKYTVGVAPLQQYIIETDKGRLQVFDIAWDTKGKRWFAVFPDLNAEAGNGFHWSGPYKNWQAQCAECHQTQFVKAYDPQKKTYASTWKELNVACAACHGGGEAHVAWAQNPGGFSAEKFAGVDEKGLLISYLSDMPATEIETCARCHSRREPLAADSPVAGSKFADNYNVALLRQDLYHADGQIIDEVYVYGSFLQSKMNAAGVRCSDCHEPHSATLVAEGNALCTQCHSPGGNTKFPTLQRKPYDSPQHYRHEIASEGAKCVNCHMPSKTYMVVDPRRDHSFKVPRPDLSVKIGIPNACTGCHQDKDAEWAAAEVKQWYPEGRSGKPHFAELFARARGQGLDAKTRQALVDFALDGEQPAIIRATSLANLRGNASVADITTALPLLKEDNAPIRAAAIQLFRGSSEQFRLGQLVPMLDDQIKSVRLAAIRELLDIPLDRYTTENRILVSKVMKEYQASLVAKADYPQTQLALAGLAMITRNFSAAEAAFREAVAMDPQLETAWTTLARIQLAQSRLTAALRTMTRAIEKNPESVPFHRMLASILMQFRQPREAVATLKKAGRLSPRDASLMVELANAQLQAKAYSAAINTLTAALRLEPDNASAIYLTAHAYLLMDDFVKAREYALRLRKDFPDFDIDQRLMLLIQ